MISFRVLTLVCPVGSVTYWHSVNSACTGPRWIPHTSHTRRGVLDCKAGSHDSLLVVHWARLAPPPSRCPPPAARLHPRLDALLPCPALVSEALLGVEGEGGPTRCHQPVLDPSTRWAHNLTCWDWAKLMGMIHAKGPIVVVVVVRESSTGKGTDLCLQLDNI